MLILVSGSTRSVAKHPEVGILIVPAACNKYDYLKGRKWAADNGAYTRFDQPRYERMLDRLHIETRWRGCLFVTAPDVVANAPETLHLFRRWGPQIRAYGATVALVAQDGLESLRVPWDDFDALFIGGSTHWKISRAAANLAAYAKARAVGQRL